MISKANDEGPHISSTGVVDTGIGRDIMSV